VFLYLKTKNKEAYVRTYDLVYRFKGAHDARALYEQEKSMQLKRLDSLKQDIEKEIERYKTARGRLTSVQRKNAERSLALRQENYRNFQKRMGDQLKEMEDEMLTGVLNQVNSFVLDYGERERYRFIYGVTEDGNLMYADSSLDITEEILIEMNKQYEGEY
jgi:outer membrane protein